MTKLFHEIRDPIHVFIHLDWYEKKVLDSRPFQRLRNINQLALTYLLYPGATHKRFEHSLGVMELAGRVFDVITKQANVTDEVMRLAAANPKLSGHHAADCIMRHRHFKVLYERDPQDAKVNSNPGAAIAKAAELEFGPDAIRYSKPKVKDVAGDFPVRERDGRIRPAISVSETLSKLQPTAMEYVFVAPKLEAKAEDWKEQNREKILATAREEEDEHETQPESSRTHFAKS